MKLFKWPGGLTLCICPRDGSEDVMLIDPCGHFVLRSHLGIFSTCPECHGKDC